MKIADVKVLKLGYEKDFPRIPRSFAVVRIETDSGIVGYGEASSSYGHAYPGVVKQIVEGILARVIRGEDPFAVERLIRKMRNYLWGYLGSDGVTAQAIGAVEIALWDIMGKSLNAPVYQLLGGAKDRVELYGTGTTYFEKDANWHCRFIDKALEKGFLGIKIRVGKDAGEWDINLVRTVREHIGEHVKLMVDAYATYTPATAIRMANLFKDYNVHFFEEPVPQSDIGSLARVAEVSPIPIAVGERIFTLQGFKEVVLRRAAHVLQPDAAICGGLIESKKICAIAEAFGFPVAVHIGGLTAIGIAANLHLAASTPGCSMLEYDLAPYQPLRDEILRDPVFCVDSITDGYLAVPQGPGLGIDVDETKFEQFQYQGDTIYPDLYPCYGAGEL